MMGVRKKKILITGTGRCGTTFLIKIMTFLGLDTGYTPHTYSRHIMSNCNSGMERRFDERFEVLKNPDFIKNIQSLPYADIHTVIIPLRDYEQSASSRYSHGFNAGGLWNSRTYTEQINFYHKIVAGYVLHMTQHDIPTVFLDFTRMVSDKEYLFSRLHPVLHDKNISYTQFCEAYDLASVSSKPTTHTRTSKTHTRISTPTTPIHENQRVVKRNKYRFYRK